MVFWKMNFDQYDRAEIIGATGQARPLKVCVETAVTNVIIPIDWSDNDQWTTIEAMTHVHVQLLKSIDRRVLKVFTQQLRAVAAYLKNRDGFVGVHPTNELVLRSVSIAYHLCNERDADGQACREAFLMAISSLALGELLDANVVLKTVSGA